MTQKANFTRRTLEAACWFGLVCWGNNVANFVAKEPRCP